MKNRLPMLLLVGAFGLATAAAAAEPLDTPEQLKKLFDGGSYKELIAKVSKIVALKGPEADSYNKYDLLTMKGEASLRIKSKSGATDAFKQASKVAKTPADIATADATAILIQQSGGTLKYTPKSKVDKSDKPEPIDIVDAASRKSAFEALEKDLSTRCQAKVDAVLKANNINGLVQESKDHDLADLREVEMASTGSDGDSKQMIGDLASHTATLLDGALDKIEDGLNGDVDAINNSGKPAKAGAPTIDRSTAVANLVRALHASGSELQEVTNYAASLKPVFGDAADFKSIETKAKKVQAHVSDLQAQVKKAGG